MSLSRLTFPVIALAALALAGQCASSRAQSPALPALDGATSLLVISPHPDDETLCCGGVIQRVLRAGGHVSIVWVTSGDGSALGMLLVEKTLFGARKMREFGQSRMREARAATALLGVPPGGQLFLGYPDGALARLLRENRALPYTSKFTDATAVPYADALFPGHPYTGTSLEQDLDWVVQRTRPTLILAPSPLDEHSDHAAAGRAAIALGARHAPGITLRFWVVHGGGGWPSPRGLLLGVPLTPSPRGAALSPVPFALDPEEQDRKLAAVRAYQTQMRVMEPFLLSFVRTTELFSTRATPAADVTSP